MRYSLRFSALLVLFVAAIPLFLGARPALAQETVLVIERPGNALALTRDDLRALPQEVFTTGTIWTEGVTEFTGVPLRALLDHAGVGAAGGEAPQAISVIAANDYAIDIPLSEIGDRYPVVAYLRDGQEFSLRDNGPLWIVYPFDAAPSFRTDEIYARSVWQLARIRVTP